MKPRLLALPVLAAAVLAQSPGPSVANGEDWSFPYTVTPHPYSGFFRDPGQINPQNIIQHQQFNASSHNWALMNPAENVYDFSFIRSALNDAWDLDLSQRALPHCAARNEFPVGRALADALWCLERAE